MTGEPKRFKPPQKGHLGDQRLIALSLFDWLISGFRSQFHLSSDDITRPRATGNDSSFKIEVNKVQKARTRVPCRLEMGGGTNGSASFPGRAHRVVIRPPKVPGLPVPAYWCHQWCRQKKLLLRRLSWAVLQEEEVQLLSAPAETASSQERPQLCCCIAHERRRWSAFSFTPSPKIFTFNIHYQVWGRPHPWHHFL